MEAEPSLFNITTGLAEVPLRFDPTTASLAGPKICACANSATDELLAVLDGNTVQLVDVSLDASSATAKGLPRASLELGATGECVAWSNSAVFAVVADAAGFLNFVVPGSREDGTAKLLFKHRIVPNAVPGEGPVFSAMQFVAPPAVMKSRVTTEELVVVTAVGRLFHFANINTALLEQAAAASNPQSLLADISRQMVTQVSPEPSDAPVPGSSNALSVSWLPRETVIVTGGDAFQIWTVPHATAAGAAVGGAKSATGSLKCMSTTEVKTPKGGKLAVTGLAHTADSDVLVVVDSDGGLSWWDSRTLEQVSRWAWPDGVTRCADVKLLPTAGDDGAPVRVVSLP
jgi:hypothetical protein